MGILEQVQVGAQDWPLHSEKKCVTGQFYKSFGRLPLASDSDCKTACDVLQACCDETTTLVTGGPLHNLGAALLASSGGSDAVLESGASGSKKRTTSTSTSTPGINSTLMIGRWVAQGGFAGEGVVPKHLQMKKFKGKTRCDTWNFNGCIPAAQAALSSCCIESRVLVSKNVCHRVMYDQALHEAIRTACAGATALAADKAVNGGEKLAARGRARSLGLLWTSMDSYLVRHPSGKKLHDPLALVAAINEAVCTFAEVELTHHSGSSNSKHTLHHSSSGKKRETGWGSFLCPGSKTKISVDYNHELFVKTLLDLE